MNRRTRFLLLSLIAIGLGGCCPPPAADEEPPEWGENTIEIIVGEIDGTVAHHSENPYDIVFPDGRLMHAPAIGTEFTVAVNASGDLTIQNHTQEAIVVYRVSGVTTDFVVPGEKQRSAPYDSAPLPPVEIRSIDLDAIIEPARPTEEPATPTEEPIAPEDTGEMHFNWGVELFHEGEYKEAIEQLDQALALGWETADLYYYRGCACQEWWFSEGACSLEQAIVDYSIAIELDPGNVAYYEERAWSFYNARDLKSAIYDYTTAIELDPENALYWRQRGQCYKDYGDYEAAIYDLDTAIELDPYDFWGYIHRASVYEELRDSAQALNDLNRAVKLGPDDPNPHFHRGTFFLRAQEWEAAISDMTQAILLNPEWPDLYSHRGDAYWQLEMIDEARPDYEKFVELTEGNPAYADWRIRVLEWLEEYEG